METWIVDLLEVVGLRGVIEADTVSAGLLAVGLLLLRAYLSFAAYTYVPRVLAWLPTFASRPLAKLFGRIGCVGLAIDMLAAAVLFLPWARKRETVSGLMGRWQVEGNRTQRIVGNAVARALHVFDPNHCVETYINEKEKVG